MLYILHSFYAEYPDDELDEDILKEFGYRKSDGVVLDIFDGYRGSLRIKAIHPAVNAIYEVDKDGRIYKN